MGREGGGGLGEGEMGRGGEFVGLVGLCWNEAALCWGYLSVLLGTGQKLEPIKKLHQNLHFLSLLSSHNKLHQKKRTVCESRRQRRAQNREEGWSHSTKMPTRLQ